MCRWFKKMRRYREDERGYSSVELVLVATTFLSAFFWVFETGLIMTKQMMLEQALDRTVRDMRLGLIADPNGDGTAIKEQICNYALILNDCNNDLLLNVEVVDLSVSFSKDPVCINKVEGTTPFTEWEPGARSEIAYIRACVIIDPMMPNGIALFPGTSASGIPLFADSAFVNEPA